MRPCLLGLFALVLGCDRSSEPSVAAKPTPTDDAKTEAPAKAPEPTAPEAKAEPKPPEAKPALTKEQRAEYHAHLDKGRTLSKASEWAEAIEELEAALEVIPGDDRALGELSWAAFSSGDHAKAREAAHAASLAATSPKVKAAALYNLGRAEEASGRIAEAKAAYAESVRLRPNKTVAARLDQLGKSAPAESLVCAAPMSEGLVCDCLLKTVDQDEAPPECALAPTTSPDFKVATYAASSVGEQNVVIVARGPKGWAVVAELATVYNPGMMGINEELGEVNVETRPLGDHTVVEITSSKSRSDTDMGIDEIETELSEYLVVCVVGDATTPTRCPLDVVTHHLYERERMSMSDEDIDEDLQTPGLPIREEMRISVELTEQGIAKLRADAGKIDADDLGDRKLW